MTFKEQCRYLVTNEQFSKLNEYVKLIEQDNAHYNLTGFKGDELWEHGIYQSLIAYRNKISENILVADIGTGAGFPIIPVLIANSTIKLTVFEPQKKRAIFLSKVKRLIDIPFEIVQERIESYTTKTNYFDLITARAVMSLQQLMEATIHIGKNNAEYLFLKGLNVEKEIREAKNTANFFGLTPEVEHIENKSDHTINLVKYRKTRTEPIGFPRAWIKIKTQPL
ncbi:16S rRNA (guanine(527)-N(7))-methyltransferase RsmG [Mycoplasmopsis agassizii]|uniref:Ribosomal RNA small subunit methyltransferase G n=1 Tax=Mycoplasmopsis agassizii TaxID=33922 RepID=A0A269TIE6_9BACT|nr:16S rRNA (guanine(527)-N(7))-methyltransferase RsmG [Mycoplasmopsis agassizii]PAK21167.1 16S rRNA (guanine(527)-N(7))-methyltransferase RsmG [Mycoplasmopsis agassizii]